MPQMKTLALTALLVMPTAFAAVIPSRTEIPFVRLYESVRIKADKGVARLSVSRLSETGQGREPRERWEFHTGSSTLEVPLPRFEAMRRSGDAVLEATPGDDSNSFGTAFHIGQGYVITNQHVLSTKRTNTTQCKDFRVRTGDGKQRFKCDQVVRCDRQADYCVIKLKAWGRNRPLPEDLPSLPLRAVNRPNAQASYAAIGNPAGEGLHFSQGQGISRHRDGKFMFYAPVHSGNSGGPLLNEDGEAIGLVYAQGQYGVTEEGYNLAVPMDFIWSELRTHLGEDHPAVEAIRQALVGEE